MEETDHSNMESKSSETETHASKKRRVCERVVVAVKLEENDKRQHRNEGPPSDCWSWRKYGQKPIKGSPYPRGYYKCSTSKGCSAKKQVERCKTDSSMLMVTYTSTHNHPGPKKNPTLPQPSNQDSKQEQDETSASSSPKQEQEESESMVPRVAVDSEDHLQHDQNTSSTPNLPPPSNQDSNQEQDEINTSTTPKQEQEESESMVAVVDSQDPLQHVQNTSSTPKQEQEESESESMVPRVAVDSEDHLQHAHSLFDSIITNHGGNDDNPFEANLQTPGGLHCEEPKSVSNGDAAKFSSLLKSEENDFFDELEELPTSSFFTSLMKRSFCEDRVIVNPS